MLVVIVSYINQCIHKSSHLSVVVCWSLADCKKLICAFGEVQAKI